MTARRARGMVATIWIVASAIAADGSAALACPGDCDGTGQVTVSDLVRGVNIALGLADLATCPAFDLDASGTVEVSELVQAVNAALTGCPADVIFPADYRDTFTEVRDCRLSIEHGVVAIRVLANPIAVEPYRNEENPLPVGSVIVKEEYDAPDCSDDADLFQWRVMRKEAPGFDPQDGDWRWQWVLDDRTILFDDKGTCIACHREPECVARDYMCTEGDEEPVPVVRLALQDLPGALLSISGTAHDDVIAVGADRDGGGPLVLRYDGSQWRRLSTGAAGDLWWISVEPIDGAFYMAGANGLILDFDPATETFRQHATPGDELLFGIWGTRPDRIWAVGGDLANEDAGGVLWRFDGDTWHVEDLSTVRPQGMPTLYKVWGRSDDEVYAVGRLGVILRYDGNAWEQIESGSIRPLFTVHGNDDIVVATGGAFDGVVLETDGGPFVNRTPLGALQMNGVFVAADGRALAVGNEGGVAARERGQWRRQEVAVDTLLDFHAAWIDPEGGVWAVGGDLLFELRQGMVGYGGRRSISDQVILIPPGGG